LAVLLFVGGMAFQAVALPQVTGSISFNGTPVFDNSTDIGSATSFTALSNVVVVPNQQSGAYATIPNSYSAAFTPFVFVPLTVPVSPLWTLTYNNTTYSFFATTMTAVYDSDLQIWNIGGGGYASIDGFADTTGTWNLSAGQTGQSFYFGSASTAIPEPSAAALMLLSLSCALGWRRRARQPLGK
jgi:hypothetical protein